MEVPLGSGPYALAAGPDGALWATLVHAGQIARVSVDGEADDPRPRRARLPAVDHRRGQ